MLTWDNTDLEEVRCFRCYVPGELRFEVPPFGVVVCPSCGQVFVSPRLSEQGRAKLYSQPEYFEGRVYGDETKRFDLADTLQRTWTDGRLDLIERASRRSSSKRMLEVGCAYGLFLARARERGWEVAGQEYSTTAVERVRETLGIDVRDGQLEDAGFEDNSFDVVCFWDVLEHVPDPGSFLATVARITRPGGVVALSCPYVSSLPARMLGTKWWTLKPWEHIWHFTPRTLARALTEAGLRPLTIRLNPLSRANFTRLDSVVALARAGG